MHVQNLHTMDELAFHGNCLKGSRPIVAFDASMDTTPFARLLKELLGQVFGVPKSSRKAKPFVDHVVMFAYADDKVWYRNYQVTEKEASDAEKASGEDIELVEIGPRFVLTPICVLEGSFQGALLYENKEFVSPNAVRSMLRKKAAAKAEHREAKRIDRSARQAEARSEDPLAESLLFQ
jgi:ribosome biogenesis protein BRX1